MLKKCLFVLIVMGVPHSLRAELQIVGVDAVSTKVSCQITLGVENTSETDILLTGWQVALQIVPTDNTTSTAFFSNLDTYTPENYVFSNGPVFRSEIPDTGETLFYSDVYLSSDESLPGKANLLSFGLTCPTDAGSFDVVLVAELSYSYWMDTNFESHDFDVVSVSELQNNVVASVEFVTVPEPPNVLILASASLAWGLWMGFTVLKRVNVRQKLGAVS